jgi:hypothetical protein
VERAGFEGGPESREKEKLFSLDPFGSLFYIPFIHEEIHIKTANSFYLSLKGE